MRANGRRLTLYILVAVVLAVALWVGRTGAAPDLAPSIREIFPQAASFEEEAGITRVLDADGGLLGWAATGRAAGYGGPMLLVVGVDPEGSVVGARVVEHRDTPMFFQLARPGEFLRSLAGTPFGEVDYDYDAVVGVTGATVSSDAIVASVRAAIVEIAADRFDVHYPPPPRSFEFGLLEIVTLVLLIVGFAAHRMGGSMRRYVRWGCQLTGLLVIGFWYNSPISLAKLTSILSGYFPSVYTHVAFYTMLVGFLVTSLVYRRNLYCLYMCPFGAAQRCISVIGGFNVKLPAWVVRFLDTARNVLVFAAIFAALITLQPALASYEPFAAMFALTGSTLQWLLLFLVLVTSLIVRTPWCRFLCPMRSFEIVVRNAGGIVNPRGERPGTVVPAAEEQQCIDEDPHAGTADREGAEAVDRKGVVAGEKAP